MKPDNPRRIPLPGPTPHPGFPGSGYHTPLHTMVMPHADQFGFEVLVHGRPINTYPKGSKVFVEGRRGSEYDLRIYNRSNRRAVAVISVDGLLIMNGKKATHNGQGYIIPAYESVVIKGFYRNSEKVAQFKFGGVDSSYAAQMDTPDNVGVIGAAFFLEREPERRRERHLIKPLVAKGEKSRTIYEAATFGTGQELGTEYGREVEQLTHTEHFNREDTPIAEVTVHYDSAHGLRRHGVYVNRAHARPVQPEPEPFPGDAGCTAPPGWEGNG